MSAYFDRVLFAGTLLLFCNSAWAGDDLCGQVFTTPDALEATIKSKPRIKVIPTDGTVVSYMEQDTGTVWNFATPANRAFPSVACRKLVEHEGAYSVATQIKCGASQTECERLRTSYEELDRRMRENIERKSR